ncbi:Carboxypeptidase regulatory-like domain-containing protein [Bryocella elongata]|uniref:Carboxypeptidase regulatory-like domain-containing protein n=1 Tax=Bryocella elongata TaxID=863522 RepID=A0A1H6CC88_9BACT|nr:carboxypeptidase-like regulatory domain-containing protein [Bryocella elongata]SEG70518.1 Carboxypeptidase regulatory-like domain-containing protein [Bryocella elongata]
MHIHARSALRLLFALTIFFAAGLASARAQGLGRISGIVTDATGAAVPSAKVIATDAGTGYASTAIANGQGEFVFASLPPTTYNLTASAPDFQTFVQNGVALKADQAVTVNPMLKVGSETQSVIVTTEAPQVDTVTGTMSQVVEQRQVNELPLNGRNAAQLTLLAPGVLPAPNISSIDQGNTKTFPVVVLITVNGSRTNQTNFMLDGGNNVDEYTNVNAPFPFPDALQEFSVQTSNYQAEYGENAGGVVNIITKSGTNNFHGDVFEYVRNRIFNAHDHFSTTVVNGVLTPFTDPLKRNQFGGVIGGPVGIPFLWKSKQGFFFAGYQGSRLRDQSATTSNDASLPSTANQAGLFQFTANGTPTTSNCIVDPSTKACFPYTQIGTNLYQATIPTTRFDKASLALLNYIPVASSNGTPFSYLQPNSQNYDEGVGRYDQALTSKDRMTARYYVDKFHLVGVLNPKNYLTYQDQSDITYQTALLSETHTFNERWLNNLIVNYQREGSVRGPLPGGIDAGTLGVNIWQPAFPSFQSISVSGDFSFGQNPHATFKRSNITLSDDVHWVKGSHDVSFGFHGELARLDVVNQNGQPGQFTFAATGTNNAMASFFLGYMSAFSQSAGQFQDNRAKFIGTYVQDSWKATPRLTLDYGLRWEPFIPQTDAGRMGQFNPTAYATNRISTVYPLAPAGLLFPGDTGMPRDGVRPNYKNFMPRLGFAWDVFGNATTSLRGGAGMFYDTRMNDLFNNGWIGSNPFTETYSVSNPTATDPTATFSNPYGASPNPFPVTLPLPANTPFPTPVTVITFDPSGTFHTPLMYNWNLSVQQQLTHTLSSQIAYVGSHGSHIFTNVELNPAVQMGATDTAGNEQGRRPYKNFASISETNMGGNTLFNALQGTLTQRIAHGLSATLSYTWSKSLDDIPYNTAVTSAGAGQAFILPIYVPNFKRLDYGPSVFDHRNNLSLSYTWVFPLLKPGPMVLKAIVNGWQMAGLVTLHSGDPLNITVGSDRSLAGLGTALDVPVRTGNGYGGSACSYGIAATTTCVNYLDPTAFATPALDTFGNVKKDSFVGPRYVDWDASLTRNFKLYEHTTFQFRAEYFNLLNHTNLGDPTGTQTSASFGRIGSDIAPRIAQLSAKLVF